jgi:hypothetical protein
MLAATLHNGECRSHVDHVSGTSQESAQGKVNFQFLLYLPIDNGIREYGGVAIDICRVSKEAIATDVAC